MGIKSPTLILLIGCMLYPSLHIEYMLQIARINNVPAITPQTAQFLQQLIEVTKPELVVELGAATGYSTLQMAQAMESEQSIISYEHSTPSYFIAKQNIDTYKTLRMQNSNTPAPFIDLHHGDIRTLIPQTLENHNIDFVFIDAMKNDYDIYLNLLVPYLHKKSIIVADDVIKYEFKIPQSFFDWFAHNNYHTRILPLDQDDGILFATKNKELFDMLMPKI